MLYQLADSDGQESVTESVVMARGRANREWLSLGFGVWGFPDHRRAIEIDCKADFQESFPEPYDKLSEGLRVALVRKSCHSSCWLRNQPPPPSSESHCCSGQVKNASAFASVYPVDTWSLLSRDPVTNQSRMVLYHSHALESDSSQGMVGF